MEPLAMSLAAPSTSLRLNGRRPRLRLLLGTALAMALAALTLGPAAAPADAAGKVAVQLVQVLATEPGPGPKEFDPSLEALRSQLEKYNYRKFKNAGQDKKDVAEGSSAQFNVTAEPGFSLTVGVQAAGGGYVALDLSLKDGKGKEVLSTRLK